MGCFNAVMTEFIVAYIAYEFIVEVILHQKKVYPCNLNRNVNGNNGEHVHNAL